MPEPPYKGPRCATTIEVNKEVLENFRMAVANRHRGKMQGKMFIEYNSALDTWAKIMNGEGVYLSKKTKTPIFGTDVREGRRTE
jgi:hypothetical protein